MFRNAYQEIRRHPGRIIATLVAIAISVAFMAGTSIFLATEKQGLGRSLNRQYAQADVVVTSIPIDDDKPDTPEPFGQAQTKVSAMSGVAASELVSSTKGTLHKGDSTLYLQFFGLPSEPFRWAKISQGAWPTSANQIALPRDVAQRFNANVGDTFKLNNLTEVTLVGLTDDPKSLLSPLGYVSAEAVKQLNQSPQLLIKAKPGVNPDELATQVKAALPAGSGVSTATGATAASLKQLTGEVNVIRNILMVFAGIALVVGMIIIANTFTILITQRRRQIGLLRAVGASSSQVRKQFFAEALLTGVIGSLLGLGLGAGVAALGSSFTGSLYWGLQFPWGELALEAGAGIVITLLAAMAPIWRTSAVRPLEALQPVLNADAIKRVSIVRGIVCGVLFAVGAGFVGLSLAQGVNTGGGSGKALATIGFAVIGSMFLAIAVMASAPLYVAGLLRVMGKVHSFTGPTSRMATMNAARNPQRAAATAVALMLAMGLIVTLQVATASVRSTVIDTINRKYPVDIIVTSNAASGFTSAQLDALSKLSGVKQSAVLTGGEGYADATSGGARFFAVNDQVRALNSAIPQPGEGEALASPDLHGQTFTQNTPSGPVTLRLKGSAAAENISGYLVSEATMKTLVPKPVPMSYWVQLNDREQFATTLRQLTPMSQEGSGQASAVSISGSAPEAAQVNRVLNILLGVITALLGVAVAIALVGVANTLGLSVIERTRESALLRALGMQKAKLRLMLLIEAISLALVGVLVGIAAGTFFGWLGVNAVFRGSGLGTESLKFTVDPWQTLILIAIAVGAGSLASILPGRRAANAAPTEALAAD